MSKDAVDTSDRMTIDVRDADPTGTFHVVFDADSESVESIRFIEMPRSHAYYNLRHRRGAASK